MKVLSDYYDFGVDVDVAAPPAAQVFDVSKELGATRGLPTAPEPPACSLH